MVCGVSWRLGHYRAALSWSRSGPPRCCVSCFFGSWSAPWFGSVPSSRPVGTGRLFWKAVRQAGHLTTGLSVGGRNGVSKNLAHGVKVMNSKSVISLFILCVLHFHHMKQTFICDLPQIPAYRLSGITLTTCNHTHLSTSII